jgi:hypothetical protein
MARSRERPAASIRDPYRVRMIAVAAPATGPTIQTDDLPSTDPWRRLPLIT